MQKNSDFFRKLQSRANLDKHKRIPIPPEQPKAQQPKQRKKLLAWMDSPTTTTGFGVVAKYLLWGIYQLQSYQIECLGINYYGDFFDQKRFPYQIIPAKLRDPRDPYGLEMFLGAIEKNDYDVVLVMNDVFVVEQIAKRYQEVIDKLSSADRKVPKLVYYYPVDCRVVPGNNKFIDLSDAAVSYSDFGVVETSFITKKQVRRIYLGTNTEVFKPLSLEEKRDLRAQYLGIKDDETFVIINVNRNSLRKDIAKTILVFSEFLKTHPNSLLYLHTAPVDAGAGSMHPIDLGMALSHLGPSVQQRVKFPANFQVANGFPEHILNGLYNCADCYLTSHNGEGFGLTQCEAMAAGIPVVVPDNTVTPELIGPERGYIYPCKESIYIDASGYRKTGRVEDILDTLSTCYSERHTVQQVDMLRKARKFILDELRWEKIWLQWKDLLERVESQVKPKPLKQGVSL